MGSNVNSYCKKKTKKNCKKYKIYKNEILSTNTHTLKPKRKTQHSIPSNPSLNLLSPMFASNLYIVSENPLADICKPSKFFA